MYRLEIEKELAKRLSPEQMGQIKSVNLHLGIFTEPYLSYMLDGRKIIESRFSKNRIAPYHQMTKDDVVIIKQSGGPIVGLMTLQKVLYFDLTIDSISKIREKYEACLCVDDTFWESKKECRYATLMVIDQIMKVTPFSIRKKGMQSWIANLDEKDAANVIHK